MFVQIAGRCSIPWGGGESSEELDQDNGARRKARATAQLRVDLQASVWAAHTRGGAGGGGEGGGFHAAAIPRLHSPPPPPHALLTAEHFEAAQRPHAGRRTVCVQPVHCWRGADGKQMLGIVPKQPASAALASDATDDEECIGSGLSAWVFDCTAFFHFLPGIMMAFDFL